MAEPATLTPHQQTLLDLLEELKTVQKTVAIMERRIRLELTPPKPGPALMTFTTGGGKSRRVRMTDP